MAKQKQQPSPFHIPENFIRQTFFREYKANGYTEAEAVAKFEALIKSGEIEFVRDWNGIKIYQFKK